MKYNITFASDLTIKGAGIKEMEGAKRRFLGNSKCQQLDSNYHKNILVEEREFMRMEREFMRMERDCEADEHL